MRAYNFLVSGLKFANFLASLGGLAFYIFDISMPSGYI